MKCRGVSATIAVLPPSLPSVPTERALQLVLRYFSPPRESMLYDSPAYGVEPPPPDSMPA
jgi:hypothetical protein